MSAEKVPTNEPLKQIGRYSLFEAIASGGMATVHLGRLQGDAGFARTVAIKRLRTARAHDKKHVTMFVDEARLAGRVQHPNVVATLDVVVSGKEIFLVLEYVHGESLKALSAAWGKTRPIEPRIASTIAYGALQGLHAAHEAKSERGEPLGLVHRDVSPQNILLGKDGIPRVVDFGVAKAAGRLQFTQTGQLKGKPRYMAPEQLKSDRSISVDRRTDVWGLAIVLGEMLTGRRLFQGNSDIDVYERVTQMPIPAPHEKAEVPLELSAVVMKGLERDQNRRFPTARAFAQAIEAVNPRGLMSQDALGEWVEGLVGDSLAKREARIRQMETATNPTAVSAEHLWTDTEVDALRGDVLTPPNIEQLGDDESYEHSSSGERVTTRRDMLQDSLVTTRKLANEDEPVTNPPPAVESAEEPLFPADAVATKLYQKSAMQAAAAKYALGLQDEDRASTEHAPASAPEPLSDASPASPSSDASPASGPSSSNSGASAEPLFTTEDDEKTIPLSMSKLAGLHVGGKPLFPEEESSTVPMNMANLMPEKRPLPPPVSEAAASASTATKLQTKTSTTAVYIAIAAFVLTLLWLLLR